MYRCFKPKLDVIFDRLHTYKGELGKKEDRTWPNLPEYGELEDAVKNIMRQAGRQKMSENEILKIRRYFCEYFCQIFRHFPTDKSKLGRNFNSHAFWSKYSDQRF